MKKNISTFLYFLIIFLYFILMIYSMENLNYLIIIINGILLIISFIGLIDIKIKYNNSLNKIKEYDYYRNLDFKNIEACSTGILLNKEKVGINTVFTAIYELETKNIVNISNKNNKIYISLNDISNFDSLNKYEKKILYYIFKNEEDKNEYDLKEIIKTALLNSTNIYFIKEIEKDIKKYINKKYYINLYDYINDVDFSFLGNIGFAGIWAITIFGYLPLITSLFEFTFPFTIILLIEYLISLILTIYSNKKMVLKKKYLNDVGKLKGLYSFMTDFTLLHEKEAKFYQLYDEYYLFAMGMGLLEKFEKELNQDKLNNNIKNLLLFYNQYKEEL